MKKLIATLLLSLSVFAFIACAASLTPAYAKNGADDGAAHDKK